MENRQLLHFGPFRLDAVALVLLRQDDPVRLNRKAVETLLILAERSPQVVTKEEIIQFVWQDRIVDEANLTQNIAVIRRTLNAGKGEPAYIETFPGRGYRLLGPVAVEPYPAADANHLAELRSPAAPVAAPQRTPNPSSAASARWVSVAILSIALFFAAAAFLFFYRKPQPESPAVVSPITRLGGQESQPAISPDGSMFAFVWEQDATQTPGIWVQSLSDSSPRRLTPVSNAAWSSPAWSPDGQSIACLRFGSSTAEVVILPLNGGPERIVTSILPTRFGLAYSHLDWSPDGSTLAIDDTNSLSEPLSIFLIHLATGRKTPLSQPEEMIIGDVAPRFSPDGRTISFIRAFHRSYQELFTIPVTGGAATRLTTDARQVSAQAWSDVPGTLLAASSRDGAFRLWRIRAGEKPISTSVYAEYPIQFTFSRRTSNLVYSVVPNDPNVWRLDFTNPPSWHRVLASSGQDASPQFSPDGSHIAFRSDRSGAEHIWISAADGTNPVQVTRGAIRPSVPRWHPSGRTLVFNDAISQEIFLATDDGPAWTVRNAGFRGVHPVFAPDGQSVYAAGFGAITRYPLPSGTPEVVANSRALSLGIAPDGKALYFVREPADTTLTRLDLTTGKSERIVEGLVPYCTSCWALAPHGIYYLGSRPKSSALQSLYYLDFQTRAIRLIADYPEPILPLGIGPFSLSPDQKSLLTVRLDSPNSDILRVANFH